MFIKINENLDYYFKILVVELSSIHLYEARDIVFITIIKKQN